MAEMKTEFMDGASLLIPLLETEERESARTRDQLARCAEELKERWNSSGLRAEDRESVDSAIPEESAPAEDRQRLLRQCAEELGGVFEERRRILQELSASLKNLKG